MCVLQGKMFEWEDDNFSFEDSDRFEEVTIFFSKPFKEKVVQFFDGNAGLPFETSGTLVGSHGPL